MAWRGTRRRRAPDVAEISPLSLRAQQKGIDGSMNVSETKSDGLLREYKIVITAAEIDAEVAKKLEELAKTVKMPGFRPGKVPLSVVKTRLAKHRKKNKAVQKHRSAQKSGWFLHLAMAASRAHPSYF